MQKLILFDVDQTILSTKGGDRNALNIAFEEVHGITDAFQGISFAGRMDLSIMTEVYSKWGLLTCDSLDRCGMSAFKMAYFGHLDKVLESWDQGIVYPGVRDLLGALAREPDVQMGLATGNFRESAFIKLRKYGLDTFFTEGGFGGDYPERSQVVARAIARCQDSSRRVYNPKDIFVIGDSPSDVEAGHANGVQTLAVGTGSYNVESLAGLKPSHVLPDLSDTEGVLALLLGP